MIVIISLLGTCCLFDIYERYKKGDFNIFDKIVLKLLGLKESDLVEKLNQKGK